MTDGTTIGLWVVSGVIFLAGLGLLIWAIAPRYMKRKNKPPKEKKPRSLPKLTKIRKKNPAAAAVEVDTQKQPSFNAANVGSPSNSAALSAPGFDEVLLDDSSTGASDAIPVETAVPSKKKGKSAFNKLLPKKAKAEGTVEVAKKPKKKAVAAAATAQAEPEAQPSTPAAALLPAQKADLEQARAVSQLSAQQIEVLDQVENTITDPGLMFQVFRLRQLGARISHEAQVLQLMEGGTLTSVDSSARRASTVARQATEAATSFENVQVQITQDSTITASAAPGLTVLLTLLLDRASSLEKFGKVHFALSAVEGRARFEITDHGVTLTPEAIQAATKAILRGQAGNLTGTDLPEMEIVGAITRSVPVTISFVKPADGSGNTVAVEVTDAAMAQDSDTGADQPFTLSVGAVATGWADLNHGMPVAPSRPAALGIGGIPPLYQEAMERLEIREPQGAPAPLPIPMQQTASPRPPAMPAVPAQAQLQTEEPEVPAQPVSSLPPQLSGRQLPPPAKPKGTGSDSQGQA